MIEQKLGDLIEIKHGYAFAGKHFCSDGPYVLLTPGNFYDEGGFKFRTDQKHYNGKVPTDFILDEGDLLIAMTEQGEGLLGSAAFVPGGKKYLHNQRLGLITPKAGAEVDLRYVYYLLNSRRVRQQIRATASGAKVRHTSPTRIYAVEIPGHPVAVQRRIASILGAYDDLIDVNRRRIAVLEGMVQGLFEEWFICFRFPGHEATPLEDTRHGALPRGWIWKAISEVSAYVNRGIPPKYDEDANTLVIGQKCIRDQKLSLAIARRQSKQVPPEKIVRAGDILINSTGAGTLGRVAQAEEVPAGSTVDSHVTIVRPLSACDRDFLGLSLFRMQPIFEHLGAGSTNQTELARSTVQSQLLIWPPCDIRARFGRIVRPMRELVELLTQKNAKLAAARDLLLPRLISGQHSVTPAERELEAA